MPGKRVSKNIMQLVYFNYYKGKSEKVIADMFFLKIRTVYNIVSRAKKEGRLDLRGSISRPKKVTQQIERKIIKTVYDSQQSRTKGFALQVEKEFQVKPKEIFLKTPGVSTKCKKDIQFATEHISLPPEYWDNVIFSDGTKIMLYYHDLVQASDSSSKPPTANFEKLSVIV